MVGIICIEGCHQRAARSADPDPAPERYPGDRNAIVSASMNRASRATPSSA